MAKPDPDSLPTPAELDILAALWRLGAATVREVHDHLAKDNGYTTTLKQMQLMVEKGMLTRVERFKSHVYQPVAPRERTQRAVAADLLRRVFDGSAKHLVLGALAAQPASAAEIAEIRAALEHATAARTKGRPR